MFPRSTATASFLLLAACAAPVSSPPFGMELSSPSFAHNGRIPPLYTCDGDDRIPPLTFSGIPPEAKSLALINDDPDAPMGTWVHWILWNINPRSSGIVEGVVPQEAIEGTNGWKRTAYGGPCPPSGTHRYFFKLYALDTALNLPSNADRKQLEAAMEDHILAKAELIGVYSRQPSP